MPQARAQPRARALQSWLVLPGVSRIRHQTFGIGHFCLALGDRCIKLLGSVLQLFFEPAHCNLFCHLMQGSGAVGFCQLVLVGQGAVSVGVGPVERDNLLFRLSTIICETEKGMGSKKKFARALRPRHQPTLCRSRCVVLRRLWQKLLQS